MVKGLDIFKEHFREYSDHYILIGGGACDVQFSQKNIDFRRTKDLDLVLIVEGLTSEFVNKFWEFIKAGEYAIAEVDFRKCFYRFVKPVVDGYPHMLELFARRPDVIIVAPDFHITDIPTGEEASSLSAILMDDDYYSFTIAKSELIDGIRVASDIALIVLKAKAFLNNRQRKEEGIQVQSVDIQKHKNDVIRLTAILTPDTSITIPEVIRNDLREYIQVLRGEESKIQSSIQKMGLGNITLADIIERLEKVFSLTAQTSA